MYIDRIIFKAKLKSIVSEEILNAQFKKCVITVNNDIKRVYYKLNDDLINARLLDDLESIVIDLSVFSLMNYEMFDNNETKYNDFVKKLENRLKLSIDWNNEDIEIRKLSFIRFFSKDVDIRFLINSFVNNTISMRGISYYDNKYMLLGNVYDYTLSDAMQEMYERKMLSKHENKNMHSILKEELIIKRLREIKKSFKNITEIFDIAITKGLFNSKKKYLMIPDNYNSNKNNFNLREYFLKNGFKSTLEYLGIQRIKDIGYKTWVELFKTCNVKKTTRFNYQKKIKDLLMS